MNELEAAFHLCLFTCLVQDVRAESTRVSAMWFRLEGISSDNAEGLLKFLTEQRSQLAAVSSSHINPLKSQKLAVVDRLHSKAIATDDHQSSNWTGYLHSYRCRRTGEAANQELASLKVWCQQTAAVAALLWSSTRRAAVMVHPLRQRSWWHEWRFNPAHDLEVQISSYAENHNKWG